MKKQLIPLQYLETDENFASSKNDEIELLLSEVMTVNVVIFMHILWFKIFQLLGDYLANHPDKVVIPRKRLTESMHCFYISIIGSVQYQQELCGHFGIEDTSGLKESHISVGSTLCMETYKFLIHKIAEMFSSDTVEDEQNLTGGLDGMPVKGLAKIRHVGGWAVRKVLEHWRRYVRTNMHSTVPATRTGVKAARAKCDLWMNS